MIPQCSGKYGALPPGRHKATLDEVYERFVVEAPFRERREMIYGALTVHAKLVASVFSRATLWIDGGFVSHKSWAPPEDADVVVVVPAAELPRALEDANIPMWTMLNASGTMLNRTVTTQKLHPMGGLLDAFVAPAEQEPMLRLWDELWSKIRDENGNEVPGGIKGYLEVEV